MVYFFVNIWQSYIKVILFSSFYYSVNINNWANILIILHNLFFLSFN
nr:MAG TPA: hypothetical protein [Caudoviricetes sp.]